MKYSITVLIIFFTLNPTFCIGQTKFIQQKAGHIFYIDVPDYMNRTIGLNNDAAIQYKNSVKDVCTIVIEDSKEDLAIVDLHYSSINEFHEEFIKDFLKDEEKRNISKPTSQSKNNINFIEFDASYYDKEAKIGIYYLVGIVESKSHFYKVLSWTNLENKDKFKADFQNTLYSLKD
ncbi:hypothetical protein EOD40_17120 [Flavobacterium sufflavum]|uniref:PsbP C-terminal domain-containing protein n=1 Tax=Flavobacterium sufflavum TaxID=1921138 RepID=A0A437KKG8_9FLAO|nr:hypothetical protein [Flavobacterium sufflavum]RVT71362.1 hypothetical protein EOD40_17120 [Flavobacterium sufflavum]